MKEIDDQINDLLKSNKLLDAANLYSEINHVKLREAFSVIRKIWRETKTTGINSNRNERTNKNVNANRSNVNKSPDQGQKPIHPITKEHSTSGSNQENFKLVEKEIPKQQFKEIKIDRNIDFKGIADIKPPDSSSISIDTVISVDNVIEPIKTTDYVAPEIKVNEKVPNISSPNEHERKLKKTEDPNPVINYDAEIVALIRANDMETAAKVYEEKMGVSITDAINEVFKIQSDLKE